MKIEPPKNANYSAQVVRVGTVVNLPGLDQLVGVPVLGYQALTTKGVEVGDLRIAFTAETALSEEYAKWNNLHRDETLNRDAAEKGYLERNRRVRAIKMRGHVSNALLMPLKSVAFTGVDPALLIEGLTFDHLGDYGICEKYVVPVKPSNNPAKTKLEKAFKRVDKAQFPEHLETDNFWRNRHLLNDDNDTVITQKLHGTSWRGGRVPVLRELKLRERIAKRLGIRVDTHEYDVVYGSRKVIKDPGNKAQQHFYATSGDDLWTGFGKTIAELIPEGYLVYGELIGFTPDGAPIQKGYTYDCKPNTAELYVYRVAHINRHGNMADLSWDGVKAFCTARGMKWTPELVRGTGAMVDDWVEAAKDAVFFRDWEEGAEFTDKPLQLSGAKTVDEGICLRQEGLVPTILKAKSTLFLEHESKMLDAEVVDMESQEAA